MPKRISSILGLSRAQLEKYDAFDGFVDLDSRLHIDPSLLANCKITEFKDSYSTFKNHFARVMLMISNSKGRNDRFWREALKLLIFKEIGNTALGYSANGTGGSAVGTKLAGNLLETVFQIVQAGNKDPAIFELVGMFEENYGADRISDITMSILIKDFAAYTQRISQSTGAISRKVNIRGTVYNLPHNPKTAKYIILVPRILLNDLPVAMCREDIDRVCRHNEELRERVNGIIGGTWKKASKWSKNEMKRIFINAPELLKEILEEYKSKPKESYDFDSDPLGEVIWGELAESVNVKYPLNLLKYKSVTSDNILDVVLKICNKFKDLIENNGWFEYIYDKNDDQKPERAVQLLFYGISDAYCEANDLDLNRETNAGIGSLDFKVSKGYKAKVNVEIKYSTNTNLVKGFTEQLPAYNRAEKTDTSIYLVVQTMKSSSSIDRLFKISNEARAKGERVPDIFIIDGQKQVSASKR